MGGVHKTLIGEADARISKTDIIKVLRAKYPLHTVKYFSWEAEWISNCVQMQITVTDE